MSFDGNHVIRERSTSTYMVEVTCPLCRNRTSVEVPISGWTAWARGAFVQDAFPDTSVEQREALLTGYCVTCQDDMFGGLDCE